MLGQTSAANGSAGAPVLVDSAIAALRRKGVQLWCQDGQLCFKAPKGALAAQELETLRGCRDEVIAWLKTHEGISSQLTPRAATTQSIPLAFSQLEHWHFYREGQRVERRQIAAAMHLRGGLRPEALEAALTGLVARHEALRTQVVFRDGKPTQEIHPPYRYELRIEDIRARGAVEQDAEILRRIEQFVLTPIDIALDPLFAVKVLHLGRQEHVLIVALNHIISDGTSLGIFVRDLFSLYRNATLPEVPIQFADYTLWQYRGLAEWDSEHGDHWRDRMLRSGHLKFARERSVPDASKVGWATVPVRVDSECRARLAECSRQNRTTLVMTVFAAYVAYVLRWCESTEAVFAFQSDGRRHPQVQDTIGFFAAMLYLRIGARGWESFSDLLRGVTREYCSAYEHADFSYITSRVPRPQFTRNTVFNWLPKQPGAERIVAEGSGEELAVQPIRFDYPTVRTLDLDAEPAILLCDDEQGITGDMYFPAWRFSSAVMGEFVSGFIHLLRRVPDEPEMRVRDIVTGRQ